MGINKIHTCPRVSHQLSVHILTMCTHLLLQWHMPLSVKSARCTYLHNVYTLTSTVAHVPESHINSMYISSQCVHTYFYSGTCPWVSNQLNVHIITMCTHLLLQWHMSLSVTSAQSTYLHNVYILTSTVAHVPECHISSMYISSQYVHTYFYSDTRPCWCHISSMYISSQWDTNFYFYIIINTDLYGHMR